MRSLSDYVLTVIVVPPISALKDGGPVLFACLNIRGLIDHVGQSGVLLADCILCILAVNETWLDSNICDNDVSVPGSDVLRRDRTVRGANGMAGFVFMCDQPSTLLLVWIFQTTN